MTRDHDEGLSEPLAKLQRGLCAALRRGATRATAAQSLGLSSRDFAEWMALAESTDPERPPPPELVRFAAAIRAAEAQAELRLLDAITTAAHAGDVRAAFWLLERRRAASTAAPSSPSTAVAVDLSTLSDEELERLARGEPLAEVPPGRLTQRDLEKMTGDQLVSLVREGRIMPAGPVIYLPEEDPEGRC